MSPAELIQSGDKLTINITSGQNDGGDYTCIAVNEAGFDNTNVTLLVEPVIITGPVSQYIKPGDDVTFSCEADSFPPPTYQWERMNVSMSRFEPINLIGSDSPNYTIKNVDSDNFGFFRCVAMATGITENATSEVAILTGKYKILANSS